MLTKHDSAIRR